MHLFFVSRLFQILTNAKETHARTEEFAQIWLPTIPANAPGSTWGGTVNTVSVRVSFFIFVFELFYNYPVIVNNTPDAAGNCTGGSYLPTSQVVYWPSKLIDQRQFAGNSHKEHLTMLQ